MKWTRLPIEGPPPASRLDFAMCHIRLCVPVTGDMSPDKDAGLLAASIAAKDVLDSQLRLGSAGSSSSVGRVSAGSSVSATGGRHQIEEGNVHSRRYMYPLYCKHS